MVHACGAINCTEKRSKGVHLKFHRIPRKDISLRKAWLHALRRGNYDPKCGFVCEKHFKENEYEINVHGNRVLKKGAVPSVFNFSPHLIKVVKGRRILKRKLCVPGSQNGDNVVQIDAENKDPMDTVPVDVSDPQNNNESTPQAPTAKFKENKPSSRNSKESDVFQESYSEINVEKDKVLNSGAASSVFHFPPHLGKPCVLGPQNEDEVRPSTYCNNLVQMDAENHDYMDTASVDISVLQNVNENASQASTSKIKDNQLSSRDLKESDMENVFPESHYEINVHGHKVLKKGAAPSVFNCPPHLRKLCVPGPQNEDEVRLSTYCDNLVQIDTENRYSVNTAPADVSVLQNMNETTPQASTSKIKENQPSSRNRNARSPVFFGDFKESDMEDEIKRKRFWKVAQTTVCKYRKDRKFYECKIRRQKSQIRKLKDILEELKKELLVIQVE